MDSYDFAATPESDAILAGYMKPNELAALLGISLRTLARWHEQRKALARSEVGRLVLYRVETVRAWLVDLEGGNGDRPSSRL